MATPVSDHFLLEELTITSHHEFDNTPPPAVVEHLRVTAQAMERVRALLKKPIHVNSGYRSPEVNAAVKGSPTSAHMSGYAVDFICPQFGSPLHICHAIVDDGIEFDQLIEEGTWVHISFEPHGEAHKMRGQIRTKDPTNPKHLLDGLRPL